METTDDKLCTVHNLGLADRMVRISFAVGFLVLPGIEIVYLGHDVSLSLAFLMLMSIYPGLTGLLGWDPYYHFMGAKSCGTSERNQCGSLPYQIDAALGHKPLPKNDWDHKLTSARHE